MPLDCEKVESIIIVDQILINKLTLPDFSILGEVITKRIREGASCILLDGAKRQACDLASLAPSQFP